jgi:hypothetical protein
MRGLEERVKTQKKTVFEKVFDVSHSKKMRKIQLEKL